MPYFFTQDFVQIVILTSLMQSHRKIMEPVMILENNVRLHGKIEMIMHGKYQTSSKICVCPIQHRNTESTNRAPFKLIASTVC